MQRPRVYGEMAIDFLEAARLQLRALVSEVAWQQGAERLAGLCAGRAFLGTRITAQAHLGMEIRGQLARFALRQCADVANRNASGFAAT